MSVGTNGNYEFTGISTTAGKNSIESTQPSLQEKLKSVKLRTVKKINRDYSVSMMQPIHLDADTSIITISNEYAMHEPIVRSTQQRSTENLNLFGTGSTGDFDYNQSKLYNAVKKQQFLQSRQIVND